MGDRSIVGTLSTDSFSSRSSELILLLSTSWPSSSPGRAVLTGHKGGLVACQVAHIALMHLALPRGIIQNSEALGKIDYDGLLKTHIVLHPKYFILEVLMIAPILKSAIKTLFVLP